MKWKKIFTLFLALTLFVGIWSEPRAQIKSRQKEARLTLAQILTGLQTQGGTAETRTLTARNRYIARRVRERGVTFALTAEFESELRSAGASEELIKAIRASTPLTKQISTPNLVPLDPSLDFNKWWNEAKVRAEKVAKLKQARYEANEALLERSKREKGIRDNLTAKANDRVAQELASTKKYRDSLEGLVAALKARARLETEAIEKKRKLIEQGLMFERDLEPHKHELARLNNQIEDTNKRITQADQFMAKVMNREQSASSPSFARELAAIQKRFDPQIRDAVTQYVAFLHMASGDSTVTSATAALKPQIIYKEKAKYTEAARRNRVQGTVLISAVFTADGQVTDFRVIRGLPDGLDDEAIKAASEIVFLPALRDGKPVSVRMSMEFTFNLI